MRRISTFVAALALALGFIAGLTGGPALLIEVTDDGRGLPTDVHEGVGLSSMRERAAEVGGACRIQRGPNGGTVVRAQLPVPPSRPDAEESAQPVGRYPGQRPHDDGTRATGQ